MRVLNVNFSLNSKLGGGTAERTFQMSRYLALAGAECTVLTIDDGLDLERISSLRPAKLAALKPLWKRYAVPRFEWRLIKQLVDRADLIHLMGHWSIINAYVYLLARFSGKPYVVCPAGALPIFGRSATLKYLYNLVIGKAIIKNAAGWIAVTNRELSQFLDYRINIQKIKVIPNGVSKNEFLPNAEDVRRRYGLPKAPTILFMGRLNNIKGPDLLLEAFGSIKNHLDPWHLVFAGPDEGMLKELLSTAECLNIADKVHFIGFVNEQDKTSLYHSSMCLIVPSRQEAMSIVALEAGISGLPTLVTDQCGFSEIQDIDSNLEVPATISGLANGLLYLISDSKRLTELGVEFRSLVSKQYSWSSLATTYLDFYNHLLLENSRTPE